MFVGWISRDSVASGNLHPMCSSSCAPNCINSSFSSALKRPKNSSSTLSPIGIAAASTFSPSAVSQTKRHRLSAVSCSRLTKPRFSILANISASVALVLTAASISATCSIPGLSAMARITAYCGWSGQVTRPWLKPGRYHRQADYRRHHACRPGQPWSLQPAGGGFTGNQSLAEKLTAMLAARK
ncbi:Uncharacterised protein [Escherichia coli]|uniref:Uncharacterized protein n=1 Tax=Escherichia coli TaxID=562 RepID=A0A377D6F8_ECOLX|nr:Uncharacterised protein [Escherichia coli]